MCLNTCMFAPATNPITIFVHNNIMYIRVVLTRIKYNRIRVYRVYGKKTRNRLSRKPRIGTREFFVSFYITNR